MRLERIIRSISEFHGLKRNIVSLFILTFLVTTGEKIWDRYLPKYFESIGASVLIIGGLGFLKNMLGALWALQGGYLSDRLGTRKSFFLFNLTAIAGYIIAIIFPNWVAVFIGMIFFSAWGNISMPASMSIIAKTLGKSKTSMGISMHSLIRRIPMAVGPVIGGFIIMRYGIVNGIRISFAVSIFFCLLGMLSQNKTREGVAQEYELVHPVSLWKQMDVRLKNILVSDILIRFCEQIPFVFVVIWCLDIIKISPVKFGVLTAIEMITALLVYIPVANYSDKLERKPFVTITFILFTVFPVILYFSKNYFALIIAFIIRGLKEFGEPTRKAMITDLCPEKIKARTFGMYYFVRDFIVSFAAFFGGWLWNQKPELNLFTATGFGILGTLFSIFLGKGTKPILK
jgi:MFS family permease